MKTVILALFCIFAICSARSRISNRRRQDLAELCPNLDLESSNSICVSLTQDSIKLTIQEIHNETGKDLPPPTDDDCNAIQEGIQECSQVFANADASWQECLLGKEQDCAHNATNASGLNDCFSQGFAQCPFPEVEACHELTDDCKSFASLLRRGGKHGGNGGNGGKGGITKADCDKINATQCDALLGLVVDEQEDFASGVEQCKENSKTRATWDKCLSKVFGKVAKKLPKPHGDHEHGGHHGHGGHGHGHGHGRVQLRAPVLKLGKVLSSLNRFMH